MAKRMGFEGKLYYNNTGPGTSAKPPTAGSTEVTIVRDVSYSFEPTEADVSDRASIIDLADVAGIKFSLEFEVNNQDTNAFVAAVRAAASGGTALALATVDKASGYGVDGDFIVKLDESQPLRDRQAIKVTCTPTDKNSRVPAWA